MTDTEFMDTLVHPWKLDGFDLPAHRKKISRATAAALSQAFAVSFLEHTTDKDGEYL
ncbi:MAG: hypothetical protein JRG73_05675 [Deltaproteobacteria bacterium]|nr:hypothetical protein [Deltaproteobacteria bacterium]